MKYLLATLACVAMTGATQAGIVTYDVTDFNGGTGGHGLWTSDEFGGDRTFSIVSGTTFTVDDRGTADVADDVARLFGQAKTDTRTADIDLVFTGGLSSLAPPKVYKQEGGLPEAQLIDPMFWADIAGIIKINGVSYDIDRSVHQNGREYTFQFGVGANAKNKTELGGSAWIQSCKVNNPAPGNSCMNAHHWDLNLAMLRRVAVPEPASLALLGLGFMGIGLARKKKRA